MVIQLLCLNQIAQPGDLEKTYTVTASSMFAWGNNNQGQLGIGSTVDQYTPVPVEGLTDVKQVFAGNDFSMALKHDGTLWAWGNNGVGQLGDNSNIDRTRRYRFLGLTMLFRSVFQAIIVWQ